MNIMNIIDSPDTDSLLREVVGACYEVSNVLGAGFLEKVYERALVEELQMRGHRAEPQVPIDVMYKGRHVGEYICDLLVGGILIVELKCCEKLADEHVAQCINYLCATGRPLMLIVNFQNPRVEWRRIYPKSTTAVKEAPEFYDVHNVHNG